MDDSQRRFDEVGRRRTDLIRLEMMWNIVDWETSKAKATLTLEQQGAYRNILDSMYKACGVLLNNDMVLMHASGCSSMKTWKRLKPAIIPFLTEVDRGLYLSNTRVQEQINKVSSLMEQRQKAAKSRWNQQKADASALRTRDAKPMPVSVTTTVTNTLSTKPKERLRDLAEGIFQPKVNARPSLQEVTDYCLERKNGIDPQQWINHYTANGWKVGRNAMKDWRAAIRTWEGNGVNRKNGNTKADKWEEFLKK